MTAPTRADILNQMKTIVINILDCMEEAHEWIEQVAFEITMMETLDITEANNTHYNNHEVIDLTGEETEEDEETQESPVSTDL